MHGNLNYRLSDILQDCFSILQHPFLLLQCRLQASSSILQVLNYRLSHALAMT